MTEVLHFVGAAPAAAAAPRSMSVAIRRGLAGRCPHCGEGRLFRAYLKVADKCPVCGEELFHQRADDAPAYLTMFIVGHFIVAGILGMEAFFPDSNMFALACGWSLLAAASSLFILPRIKGALVGYQWATRMHGFGGHED